MTEQSGVLPGGGQAGVALRAGEHDGDGSVATVADSVIGLLRTVRRSKARLMAAAGDDVDSATQLLLRTIAVEGSMRASALAAGVQSDLSTVSRQVAVLVTRGLLERQADPADGRASLLVVTDAGRSMLAEREQARSAFFQEVLSGWSAEERGQFAHLLNRFTAAYDTTHTHWTANAARHGGRTGKPEEGSTT